MRNFLRLYKVEQKLFFRSPDESYIDGIWNKDDESEWLSEIQVPVRRMAE